jgi:hypothetical protein
MVDRIQRKRTKGFRQPEKTVYCGRKSVFANPYTITEMKSRKGSGVYLVRNEQTDYCSVPFRREGEAHEHAVYMFKNITYITNEKLKIAIAQLKQDVAEGKILHLSCFCDLDMPCHTDFILELVK